MRLILCLTLLTTIVGIAHSQDAANCKKGHEFSEKCIIDGEEIKNARECRKARDCCYDPKSKKCFSTRLLVIVIEDGCSNAPCTYMKDGLVYGVNSTNESDCDKQKKFCCWDRKQQMCFAKPPKPKIDEDDDIGARTLFGGIPPPPADPFNQIEELNAALIGGEEDITARSLLPPICQPPKTFPFTCHPINPNVPYVLEPPTNIPYCVRVPCSLDKQKQGLYDTDLESCGKQPGCFFDKELAEYRKYNVPTMPGVPVCQFAIRSAVFHREAQKVVDILGYWNPYFTYCTLESFKDEIRKGPEGCRLLDVLDAFHVPAKMAGWGSINEKGCSMIDACWRPGKGCFYPVDLNAIVVKSGQKLQFNPHEVVFGRPKCQHFPKRNSHEALQSYHRCLIAGCSVDVNVLAAYYNNLFEIGKDMSPQDHWKYWEEIKTGQIGAHNLERIRWPREKNSGTTTTPAPTTTKRPFPFIPGFPRFPGNLGSGASTPSLEDITCGPAFRNFGRRPCPPTNLRPPVLNLYCPYKAVVFPKFDRLKGSTEGCCDINECYITTRDIRKMHSGPASYWSQWSFFSPCTAACGSGKQTRTRECIGVNKNCVGHDEETRKCNESPCGWSKWSAWSSCNFCLKTRTRTCNPPFHRACVGSALGRARCRPCNFG